MMSAESSGHALRLHHTGLHVLDLDQSLRFYCDLLGFDLVLRWQPSAPYVAMLVGYAGVELHAAVIRLGSGEVRIELLEYRGVARRRVDTRTANPGTCHIAVEVDDVDPIFSRLTAAGVKAVSEPVTLTIGPNRGGRAVYVIDPDGFRIELLQPPRDGPQRGMKSDGLRR
jgi:lactoylglutathione lyase